MASKVTRAKRQMRNFARNGGNWRLKGLFLAGLDTTSPSPSDVAKAWPVNKSDYRFLSDDVRNHASFGPERTIALEEESEGYRRLSDATKNGDWSESMGGMQEAQLDRVIKRTLAFGDSVEEYETLWQDQLLDTVIEGSRKAQIARDAANVINVERQQGRHPRGQDDAFAREVSEGGAIRDDMEDYDKVEWDTTKFGEGARATDELIDQALIDVIERQVEWLGRQCENAVNRQWLTELVDNASTTVDSSAEDNRGVAAINEAIHQVELNDHMPDTVVQHPTFTKTLFDTAENNAIIPFANEFGDDEGIRDRVAFPLLGLEGFRGSDGVYDPDGSSTWDYTGASETGAVVYDRDLVNIYMYRDIEVKDYEDPIRDLNGVNARVEVDCQYAQSEAAAAIDHS